MWGHFLDNLVWSYVRRSYVRPQFFFVIIFGLVLCTKFRGFALTGQNFRAIFKGQIWDAIFRGSFFKRRLFLYKKINNFFWFGGMSIFSQKFLVWSYVRRSYVRPEIFSKFFGLVLNCWSYVRPPLYNFTEKVFFLRK